MRLKTVNLSECGCMTGSSADQAEPVIRNVKVLGLTSLNGRRYLPEAVSAALPLYEGRVVNIDHPDGPNSPRRLKDRFGRLEHATLADDGVRADLRYNPAHPLAEMVKWYAANDPAALGLSHNAVGEGKTENGIFTVHKIVNVRSVDVVSEPATNKSLFESAMEPDTSIDAGAAGDSGDDAATHLGKMILAVFHDEKLSQKEKWQKIKGALKLADNSADEEDDEEEGKDEPDESHDDDDPDAKAGKKDKEEYEEALKIIMSNKVGKQLVERLDALEAKSKTATKREKAAALCDAAKLPRTAVSDLFLESLVACPDDKAMKALIEDRKALVGVKQPRSAGKGDAAMDLKAFKQKLLS